MGEMGETGKMNGIFRAYSVNCFLALIVFCNARVATDPRLSKKFCKKICWQGVKMKNWENQSKMPLKCL